MSHNITREYSDYPLLLTSFIFSIVHTSFVKLNKQLSLLSENLLENNKH